MDTDKALRPLSFKDFLGQENSKYNLQVFVSTAKAREEALDHILLTGGPGLGKTTLAQIIANEMGSRLIVVNSSTIKTKGELVGILLNVKKNDILFLDEIHSLKPVVEEILYPAMEDSKLEIVTGEGAMASSVTIDLPAFTLIGATTRAGLLQKPLRDRFGEIVQMIPYSNDELSQIIKKNAIKLNIQMTENGSFELAKRSRGTPRIANRLLRRVRDFAQFNNVNEISDASVNNICSHLGIDPAGLDLISRNYLNLLVSKEKPIGINLIASSLGESEETIEDSVEPFLLQIGFVERTQNGRKITKLGASHLES
jgi:Holliday junction DNA helicase RuvB